MIVRIRKGRACPYTAIPNRMLTDPELSLKAKGLLSYLLSKPDDWEFYHSQIEKHLKEERHSIGRIFKELLQAGYCQRTRVYQQGKIKGYSYTVYEEPRGQTVGGDTMVQNVPRLEILNRGTKATAQYVPLPITRETKGKGGCGLDGLC